MAAKKGWVVSSETQCAVQVFENYRAAENAAFAIADQTNSAVAIESVKVKE